MEQAPHLRMTALASVVALAAMLPLGAAAHHRQAPHGHRAPTGGMTCADAVNSGSGTGATAGTVQRARTWKGPVAGDGGCTSDRAPINGNKRWAVRKFADDPKDRIRRGN